MSQTHPSKPTIVKYTNDEATYSAVALWSLTGDAGLRLLAAATLGWKAAQDASRTDFIPPILAQLLADPYHAVRLIAYRALKSMPEFKDMAYDYIGPVEARQQSAVEVFRRWHAEVQRSKAGGNREVLLTDDGNLLSEEFSRLNRLRDNKQVLLAE